MSTLSERIKGFKGDYERAVNCYLSAFLYKQGFIEGVCFEEPGYWVDRIGGIYEINGYYLNFEDIQNDMDNDVPKDIILEWYDEYVSCADEGRINYETFLRAKKLLK